MKKYTQKENEKNEETYLKTMPTKGKIEQVIAVREI